MLTKDERDTIRDAAAADPDFMVDLFESSMYDQSVDVSDLQEAKMLLLELAHLCSSTMDIGTAARVARLLEE